MKDQMKHDLEVELKRLNESAQKLISTRGYTKEAEKIKLLEELIREQLTNENSRHSTRQTR